MTSTGLPLALLHFNEQRRADGDASWVEPGTSDKNPNYGDMLVCDAVVRQVADTNTVRLMFGEELQTPVRGAVLRGSTYLSRKYDYERAIRTIESVDAPVAAVGLGAQSPGQDPGFLDDVPEAHRFVKLLAERSTSISARGEFTAAVLERLGATNVRVTGCPSMFHSLGPPRIRIPDTLRDERRSLGVSMKTGVHKNRFCRHPGATIRKHNRALQFALRSAAHVSFFEQGVELEYTAADERRPRSERLEAAAKILERFPPSSTLRPRELVDHMVRITSVGEWLREAARLDAMIGFRFHGNMVGLAQGLPCFYFVYDSRITEFCLLYRLPYLAVEDPWVNPVAAMLEHDWDDTTRAIDRCFRELVTFYEENDVPHTLSSDESLERPAAREAR